MNSFRFRPGTFRRRQTLNRHQLVPEMTCRSVGLVFFLSNCTLCTSHHAFHPLHSCHAQGGHRLFTDMPEGLLQELAKTIGMVPGPSRSPVNQGGCARRKMSLPRDPPLNRPRNPRRSGPGLLGGLRAFGGLGRSRGRWGGPRWAVKAWGPDSAAMWMLSNGVVTMVGIGHQ